MIDLVAFCYRLLFGWYQMYSIKKKRVIVIQDCHHCMKLYDGLNHYIYNKGLSHLDNNS